MLLQKRPAASAPGVFGIPRGQPAAQAVKSQAGKKRVISLRSITGKSVASRPSTHRTAADMPAIREQNNPKSIGVGSDSADDNS